jgi:hypothetical protein
MTNNNREFIESLRQIGDFLVENRAKTDYVLDCFFQQEVKIFPFNHSSAKSTKKNKAN